MGLLFYAYVGIHQVRRLVFDIYQMCSVPLKTRHETSTSILHFFPPPHRSTWCPDTSRTQHKPATRRPPNSNRVWCTPQTQSRAMAGPTTNNINTSNTAINAAVLEMTHGTHSSYYHSQTISSCHVCQNSIGLEITHGQCRRPGGRCLASLPRTNTLRSAFWANYTVLASTDFPQIALQQIKQWILCWTARPWWIKLD